MEIVAAVAIGLNPYVGAFVLASLAAFTGHIPLNEALSGFGGSLAAALAILYGLAAPVDFVLGKFRRFAPGLRRVSQVVAPVSAAMLAALVARPEWPLPVVSVAAAVVAWTVAAMLTATAARASRSPAWVGYGHVPVLMSAVTGAAIMVPLAAARAGIGIGLAAVAITVLVWSTLSASRPAPAPAARPRPLAGQALGAR